MARALGEPPCTRRGKEVTGQKSHRYQRDNRVRPMERPEALVSAWYDLRGSRAVKSQRLRPRGLRTAPTEGATRSVSRVCAREMS